MIKTILVGLSGTEYTDVAIQRGVELGRQFRAELTGATVVDSNRLHAPESVPIGGNRVARVLKDLKQRLTQDRVQTAVDRFTKRCKEARLPFRVQRESGDAFQAMLECSRYHDLTIFGLRSLFEYFFDDEQDSSTLLSRLLGGGVQPIFAAAKNYQPIERVLAAYSGSVESALALRRFVQMQLWPEAQLRIVTFGQDRHRGEDLLRQAAWYCRAHGRQPETEHINGPPSEQLLEQADAWHANLIVMGKTSGARRAENAATGDTLIPILRRAERPLFLC